MLSFSVPSASRRSSLSYFSLPLSVCDLDLIKLLLYSPVSRFYSETLFEPCKHIPRSTHEIEILFNTAVWQCINWNVDFRGGVSSFIYP